MLIPSMQLRHRVTAPVCPDSPAELAAMPSAVVAPTYRPVAAGAVNPGFTGLAGTWLTTGTGTTDGKRLPPGTSVRGVT